MSDNGCAAIVVPSGILSSGGTAELIRKELIGENILECIIRLPAGIFPTTNVSTAIMLINKRKGNNTTLLIDSSAVGTKHRKRHYLPEFEVDSVLEVIKIFRKEEHPENLFPNLTYTIVTSDQFLKEYYDFEPNRYFKKDGIFPRFSSMKIAQNLDYCHELEIQISEVQKRINQFFLNQD